MNTIPDNTNPEEKEHKIELIGANHPLLRYVYPDTPTKFIQSPVVQDDIDRAIEFAKGTQKGGEAHSKGLAYLVGLSSPQIGFATLKFVIVDRDADGKGKTGNHQVFFNPKLSEHSSVFYIHYEACGSVRFMKGQLPSDFPQLETGDQLMIGGIVERHQSVLVTALDRFGNEIKPFYVEGYQARIFQHECDHLNGVLFTDHVVFPEDLHLVLSSEFGKYRDAEGWRDWSRKCSLDNLKQVLGRNYHVPAFARQGH
jgi:peptide deformylase